MTTTRDDPTPTNGEALAGLIASEVQVGTNNECGIYLAPEGNDMPAHTWLPWADPWACLGYLSDDGPTISSSTDSESLVPWQSVAPIRTVITSREVQLQMVMWQLNPMTLALYFDADEPAEEDGEVDFAVRTDQAGHTYSVAIDARDGNRVFRVSFARANLADAGDMPISRGAVIPLDVTLSALEDNGQLAHVKLGPAVQGQPMSASRNGTNGPGTVEQRSEPGHSRRQRGAQPPAAGAASLASRDVAARAAAAEAA